MKYDREHRLRADLRECIYEWNRDMGIGTPSIDAECLAEKVFYMLLHAGDLKDERPVKGKTWMVDVTGLSDEEAGKKIQKALLDVKKGKPLLVKFTPKSLKMKVDADSPFKGEVL